MTKPPHISAKKPNKFWLEFGPLLVFVIAYQFLRRSDPDGAMLTAAGIFMVLAIIALAYAWLRFKTVSKMLLLTTIIIVVTASLAILSGNKTIFFMKPTIINALFGIAVMGGVIFKKNIMEMFLGEAFIMPLAAWNTLAIRWGFYFFAMALLNEYIWRNFSEDFWVNFKLVGFFPISILFTMSQIPFILKHGKIAGTDQSSAED